MPELPEVETVARDLRHAGLTDQVLTGLTVLWPPSLDRPALPSAQARLSRQQIQAIARRGKYLQLHLSGGETLLIHLRMTGQLDLLPASDPLHPHTRLFFTLENGTHLRFRDQRKFGRVYLVSDPTEIIGTLGPEPIDPDFTVEELRARLTSRRRHLKPLLLDQTFLAGLGNIYVDEALWLAKLHPLRASHTLQADEVAALWHAMREVLQRGIANAGTSFSTYLSVGGRKGSNQEALQVFQRSGQPCPRCQTPIQRLIVGQRSTHICPTCQQLPHEPSPLSP